MPYVIMTTEMAQLPSSCHDCDFSEPYGYAGDRYCHIKRQYFTGNLKPPHKRRPTECPLTAISDEKDGT